MKTPVIASIIIASAILSGPISAQAGERHEFYRNHEFKHQYRDSDRREFRNREMRREFRGREVRREHRYHDGRRWAKWHRRNHRYCRVRHHHRHYRPYRSAYVEHRYEPAAHVVVYDHGHGAPVVAGALIGSVLANEVSHGDPGATFVGAMTGAMIAAH